MISLFNSESVYLGTDMKRFNEIRDYLDLNKIEYKYKVRNHMGEWVGKGTVRGNIGSAGNAPELTYEYEILINKKDKERLQSAGK